MLPENAPVRRTSAQLEELDYRELYEAVFIDGTKMESRAGRNTFCWRGSIEKKLALAFDIKKNWMKAEAHREGSHLSRIKKTA